MTIKSELLIRFSGGDLSEPGRSSIRFVTRVNPDVDTPDSEIDPFVRMDATEQAGLVRSGEVSALDLVDAAIGDAFDETLIEPFTHAIVERGKAD